MYLSQRIHRFRKKKKYRFQQKFHKLAIKLNFHVFSYNRFVAIISSYKIYLGYVFIFNH
jgi:hypothetical protein